MQCSLCGRKGEKGFTGPVCTATRACRARRASFIRPFVRQLSRRNPQSLELPRNSGEVAAVHGLTTLWEKDERPSSQPAKDLKRPVSSAASDSFDKGRVPRLAPFQVSAQSVIQPSGHDWERRGTWPAPYDNREVSLTRVAKL